MLVTDFDNQTFRAALGSFATGVAVVTTVSDTGERHGLTVSSFNSVSLSPPLVLFSVAKGARSFAAWQRSQRYVINVLSEEHQELSRRFGRASEEKWQGLEMAGCEGGPLLPEALASFDCAAYNRYDGGDHEIFVGRVLAISRAREVPPHPLLFYAGRYRRIERDEATFA